MKKLATKKQLKERKRELQKEIRRLKCLEYHRKNKDELNRKAREKYAQWSFIHVHNPLKEVKFRELQERREIAYQKFVENLRKEEEKDYAEMVKKFEDRKNES